MLRKAVRSQIKAAADLQQLAHVQAQAQARRRDVPTPGGNGHSDGHRRTGKSEVSPAAGAVTAHQVVGHSRRRGGQLGLPGLAPGQSMLDVAAGISPGSTSVGGSGSSGSPMPRARQRRRGGGMLPGLGGLPGLPSRGGTAAAPPTTTGLTQTTNASTSRPGRGRGGLSDARSAAAAVAAVASIARMKKGVHGGQATPGNTNPYRNLCNSLQTVGNTSLLWRTTKFLYRYLSRRTTAVVYCLMVRPVTPVAPCAFVCCVCRSPSMPPRAAAAELHRLPHAAGRGVCHRSCGLRPLVQSPATPSEWQPTARSHSKPAACTWWQAAREWCWFVLTYVPPGFLALPAGVHGVHHCCQAPVPAPDVLHVQQLVLSVPGV